MVASILNEFANYAGDEDPDTGSDDINQKLFSAIVQGN